MNSNGIEDEDDIDITVPVNITLIGLDISGKLITETAVTNQTGEYYFRVAPGSYTITEEDPSGYLSTGSEIGTIGSGIISNHQLKVTVGNGEHSRRNDFLDINIGGLCSNICSNPL